MDLIALSLVHPLDSAFGNHCEIVTAVTSDRKWSGRSGRSELSGIAWVSV